ncbi:NAD(P)/FAD-dependent oxidoreductase [Flavobacterium sp. N2270]|uniref:NAD(P)/FAD-dependent oxidoreductase n=1 Tax=Flavobacterium sp. N2270 TaxID=2986831 RepID=UPI002224A0C7|nr:FAD-dependent oxidoreductase [Flavobacterium sp. N2270]
MIDYLIVGAGIAGVSFSEIAIQNNKSVLVFDDGSQPSSKVAGGMYNPVILKRFSEVWKAKEQLALSTVFYKQLEEKLFCKFDYNVPVLRVFNSIEEQNNWFQASDKPNLSPFLSTTLLNNTNVSINAKFGFGEVYQTGYLDVNCLVDAYSKYLIVNNLLISERIDYSLFEFGDDFVAYKDVKAKNVIFAEGFGMHSNPFFKDLPLDGTKGELLLIKSADLKIESIINASIFIIPIGKDCYKVGATYDWNDKTNTTTEEAKTELLSKLEELINCKYEVLEHFAGVRPTVKDRRPLVGLHPNHPNMYILNGLGTRGVMLGPFLAHQLFNYIENNIPLDEEINIDRIYKKRN